MMMTTHLISMISMTKTVHLLHPRRLERHHLIKDASHSPYVSGTSIALAAADLGRHVERPGEGEGGGGEKEEE